jgi:protein TonB
MLSNVYKLILACAINFILFCIIPALHDLFGSAFDNNKDLGMQQRVVAEMIQPKKKEKKVVRKKIRKVSSEQSRSTMSSMQMRFNPDLGVAEGEGVAVESRDLEAVIFEEGETDEDPVPLHISPVAYPNRAKELGIQGVLLIEIVIGLDGKVESVEILKSPHPSFSSEARKTVKKWRFKPAKNKGVPVRIRARKEFEFQLR